MHHFCDRSDRYTIFEDLRILDLRTEADMIGRRETIDGSWKRVVAAVRVPKIAKADGTPDQRYAGWWDRDDAKLWPLLSFIDRINRVAAEGDMTAPTHVWKDPGFRPAQIDDGMVFFLDWRLKPLYLKGGYAGFLQNVTDLLELTKELLEEVSSR